MEILKMTGAVILLFGALFLFLGALGVVRMPDSYNRIQAGTKATTLGTILSMIGLGFIHPSWSSKLIVLLLFIVFTNPISSHVLAKVMYFLEIPIKKGGQKVPGGDE
jgi:multicomponent Na+:H+ antiporter subunit G